MAKNTAKAADPAAGPPAAPPASYEDALAELEALVAAMDAGQMRLDDLIVNYRRGAELLAFCRERLARVEEQVKVMEADGLKAWNPQS